MSQADSQNTTNTTDDPVVELAVQLLRLWDANDGCDVEYSRQQPPRYAEIHESNMRRLDEWREAVATSISFSRAKSINGALAQMAVAMERIGDIGAIHKGLQCGDLGERVLQVDRLLRSAVRALRHVNSIDPDVRAIVECYCGDGAEGWTDRCQDWAQIGRDERLATVKIEVG